MRDLSLSGWQDYWKLFDELISLLNSDNNGEISTELKDAQKYVNGLTDGWYEFKFAFEKSLQSNRLKMTSEQTDIANFLIMTLNKSLKNS
jgi:hypothetical protein